MKDVVYRRNDVNSGSVVSFAILVSSKVKYYRNAAAAGDDDDDVSTAAA